MESLSTPDGINRRIRELLSGIAGVPSSSITPTTPLLGTGLELDSVAATALLAAIDHEFGVNVLEEDMDLDCLDSVGTLAEFVFGHISPE
jgi:acyl carrier protein